MNREVLKISGFISSIVIIIISLFYFIAFIYNFNITDIRSLYYLLRIFNLIALFFIFYSASQFIKEFNALNLDSLIYVFIGIKTVFLFFSLIPPEIRIGFMYINNVLYIVSFLTLAIITIKLIKISDKELNIKYFKIFVISYLTIIFFTNTFNYYLFDKLYILNISVEKAGNTARYVNFFNIIPFFFALIFYIKPFKSDNNKEII